MDHMMPGMDGIETTAAIRLWEKEQQIKGNPRKQIPIIALTANAVVGMREMFIKNGFNDFISKPIDVSKLDEMLNRWIPDEKKAVNNEQTSNNNEQSTINDEQTLIISGVDVQKGVAMTGGTLAAYKQVLSLFRKDAEDRLPLLQRAPAPDALTAFITHVHALKSALASLGAEDVSAKAAALEAAGKAEDMAFIRENLSAFAQKLGELAENIRTALRLNETVAPDLEPSITYSPLFKQLADALEAQKSVEIDRTLEELNQKPLDAQTREALQKISDDVLIAEFDSALKIINSLRAQGNKSEI